ncbi:hypothetical protein BJP40_06590 [Streptomyces sp. CC53]|nr:hypothetical protein BJP40_06590 [Streptomyces sp. CC53]
MTARDNFLTAYNDSAACYCGDDTCPSIGTLIDTLLHDHAHELAEKQRNQCRCFRSCGCCSCRITPGEAADLIDPEVA